MINVGINLYLKTKTKICLSLVVSCLIFYTLYIHYDGPKSGIFLIFILLGVFLFEALFRMIIWQVLKGWVHQNVLENELNSIITNLEESIIVKSNNSIPYSNRRGKKILNYLQKLGGTTDQEKLLKMKIFEL